MSKEDFFGESAIEMDVRTILWSVIVTALTCGGGYGLMTWFGMLMDG